MRPLRLTLLLSAFVALPIFLTCLSLLSIRDDPNDAFDVGPRSPPSRLRTFFTFQTPSSLFPPSAIISLTYDNSTFFVARPAAFGPSLPSKGLSGQLWVGRGFGDEILNHEGDLLVTGWELGCSDVPGWDKENKKHSSQLPGNEKSQAGQGGSSGKSPQDVDAPEGSTAGPDNVRDSQDGERAEIVMPSEDGTDDHLHHPLQDSNPAKASKPGESANTDAILDRTQKPTHADIESLQESAAIAGKVVLLSRGGCGFLEKVKWAQRRGGIALIVGDNERGAPLTIMYAKGDTSNVTIPAIFTSYTSAHLLSSLVPPEELVDPKQQQSKDGKTEAKKAKAAVKEAGPTFTAVKSSTKQSSVLRPTIVPANSKQDTLQENQGWTKKMMSKLGLGEDSAYHWRSVEDSRRPPSSGNIDWVLVEDWADEDAKQKNVKGKLQAETKSLDTKATATGSTSLSPHPTGDDFVIGVQDWRDADLVAPKRSDSTEKGENKRDKGLGANQQSSSSVQAAKSVQTGTLKGGSITPGSGEYNNLRPDEMKSNAQSKDKNQDARHQANLDQESHDSWFKFWRWGKQRSEANLSQLPQNDASAYESNAKSKQPNFAITNQDGNHKGLWVTLTPSSVSASPFFDTLLVLVVSPLVTLSVVYALLLLRSRIRRRRWRAPKSVVERLPVRTYHTLTTSSSTTSSQVPSPTHSSPTSPLLRSTPQDVHSRPRPRSQTTTGVINSASAGNSQSPLPPPLVVKQTGKASPAKRKRYTGRQVECVVCLEEYVDGESRVMSLPCGHEFHAECITPWLVNRRRTCPICKGDVVRSLRVGRGNSSVSEDEREEEGEETADNVQTRVLETVNDRPSAAIPIPTREDEGDRDEDGDVERGDEGRGREQERDGLLAPRSNWRNIVSSSLSRLSGDTVWRSTTPDRSR